MSVVSLFQPHSVTKTIMPYLQSVPPVLLCVPPLYPTVNAVRHLSKPELSCGLLRPEWFCGPCDFCQSTDLLEDPTGQPTYLPPTLFPPTVSDADELLPYLGRCRGSLRVRWSPPILWGSGQESVRCGSHPLCWSLLESLVSCEWAPCQGEKVLSPSR